jgi:EAL domain-containing protein (putative c-di-GMP-specific phosphodiesterase class I)
MVHPEVAHHHRDHELAADVARGLRNGEFLVHYQPQFDLKTGEAAGSEALLRWNHPERGLLLPASFMPVVESTGAITELAFYVVRAVAAERVYRGEVGLRGLVAVNLAVEDLLNESFLQVLRDPEYRLWNQISLELTETQFARAEAVTALEELAALGYGIALDDFGTGYSALSAIHTLPVSIVKIDQSFVARLPHDASAEALIAAITAMCGQLAITVVAEGIETQAQERAVRDLGCQFGQGYLFGRPMPLDAFTPEMFDSRAVPKKPRRSPAEAPIGTAAMDRLFELHATGASPATIAAALNRSGYRAAGGTRWHARSVVKALGDGAS